MDRLRTIVGLLVVLSVAQISACQIPKPHTVDPKFKEHSRRAAEPLAWVFEANPGEDAAKAIAKGDLRYWGIYGASIYVPSLPSDCRVGEEALRMMDGTSDVVLGYEHAKAIAVARVYAEQYNLLILVHRLDSGLSDCPTITISQSKTHNISMNRTLANAREPRLRPEPRAFASAGYLKRYMSLVPS